ncbi:MAG: S8/S53 family peptidase [Gammaproteobacteria bacterium]|nr:S8/S53 family peptidase [Gammaproteobacteria bacterium]
MANEWQPERLLEFGVDSCRGWNTSAAPASGYGVEIVNQSDINFREERVGTRFRLRLESMATVELEVIDRAGRPSRFISSLFNRFGDPLLLVALDSECEPQIVRRVDYSENGQATRIVSLDRNLAPRGEPEWLNPALEFVERDATALKHPGEATPLRVGMVDSGVNYLLPEINRRLARDADNRLIGYDFWDMDDRPYDAHPVNSGFFVQRHGTRTASVLLREADAVELVPYRYPRPDMSRMQALIEHAASHGVEILGMPLGSNRPEDWSVFERSARAHPRMLFVVSAGNNGRDIDEHPVYPASLDLDNLLVVTSSDDFVRPAVRTNWGRISVDYLVPAERLPALDYSGKATQVSGSSYAVSRITALAARLKITRPDWHAAEIVAELRRRYAGDSEAARKWVGGGYIADPLAGAPITMTPLTGIEVPSGKSDADALLSLDVLIVDPRWTRQKVEMALQEAFDTLGQCNIAAGNISVRRVDGADYLRDLSTGGARTLLEAAKADNATVVFARDTRMQAQFTGEAFGIANTRMRPWLANSVWMMLDVDDVGIALAHELFHVLVNSGAHVETGANLMQGRTRPDSTMLTPSQCRLALEKGAGNRLLE